MRWRGVAEQLVLGVEQVDVRWQIIDAQGWSSRRLAAALEQQARHCFDLAVEIPLRASLFRVTDDEHVLVVVAHHIAADGWSLRPLVTDWEWLMPVGVRGGRRVGRGWRCSMSITRCGSAPTWVS